MAFKIEDPFNKGEKNNRKRNSKGEKDNRKRNSKGEENSGVKNPQVKKI